MSRFALRMPEDIREEAAHWAERDGKSINEWLVAAIERETIRRGLLAHNEYVKTSPSYSMERWQAKQADISATRGLTRR